VAPASGGYAVARCTPIAFSCACRGASPEPTETGGLTWSIAWMFDYREEHGHDEWQRLRGSVVRNANGTEHVDAREPFAKAIATRAGWAPPV
jgi:hypothetical protein